VPSSDLPVDRGVTYERRRPLRTEAWPPTPNSLIGGHAQYGGTVGMVLTACRRAKAIETELYKRAHDGVACAELAAVLQE
jgi:hypothetical protein